MADLEKHSVNISHAVWGELKLRAYLERTSASALINNLVIDYLKRPYDLNLSGYRSHNPDEDRKGRSVHFQPGVWDRLSALCDARGFSTSSLIETLICIYLGILPPPDQAAPVGQAADGELDPDRYVRVGDRIYDIGENPTIISAETGLPPAWQDQQRQE